MIALLLAQSARILAGEPGFDHIEDIAVVAQFLADSEQGDVALNDVEIVNRDGGNANTLNDFVLYARDCSIEEISAIASASRRLPVGVTWDCGRLVEQDGERFFEERKASFWITDGTITKIAFGNPVVIRIEEFREAVQRRLEKKDGPNG